MSDEQSLISRWKNELELVERDTTARGARIRALLVGPEVLDQYKTEAGFGGIWREEPVYNVVAFNGIRVIETHQLHPGEYYWVVDYGKARGDE